MQTSIAVIPIPLPKIPHLASPPRILIAVNTIRKTLELGCAIVDPTWHSRPEYDSLFQDSRGDMQ